MGEQSWRQGLPTARLTHPLLAPCKWCTVISLSSLPLPLQDSLCLQCSGQIYSCICTACPLLPRNPECFPCPPLCCSVLTQMLPCVITTYLAFPCVIKHALHLHITLPLTKLTDIISFNGHSHLKRLALDPFFRSIN